MSVITSLLGVRARRIAGLAMLLLGAPLAAHAQATTACGESVKAEIVKQLESVSQASEAEQLKMQAAIYDKYKACGTTDAANLPSTDPFYIAARQCGARVSFVGSL